MKSFHNVNILLHIFKLTYLNLKASIMVLNLFLVVSILVMLHEYKQLI